MVSCKGLSAFKPILSSENCIYSNNFGLSDFAPHTIAQRSDTTYAHLRQNPNKKPGRFLFPAQLANRY
jgi:hypothetical protein